MECVDLFSPDSFQDPYPAYRQLQSECPVFWHEGFQSWMLSRYSDVLAALRHRRLSAAYTEYLFLGLPPDLYDRFYEFRQAYKTAMIFSDPPEHTRRRNVLRMVFTRRFIEGLRVRIESVVRELSAQARESGGLDLLADFANVLPARVIARELGAPSTDAKMLKDWGEALLLFLGRHPDDTALAERTLEQYNELASYFRELFDACRRNPRDNLLAPLMVTGPAGETLTEEELLMTCISFLIAGIETSANLICNGVIALFQNPDQLVRLRLHPNLLNSAVEEVLRFESPIKAAYRVASDDMTVCGRPISAGERLTMLLGAANRDERQFLHADRLDIGRAENRHVAFGMRRF